MPTMAQVLQGTNLVLLLLTQVVHLAAARPAESALLSATLAADGGSSRRDSDEMGGLSRSSFPPGFIFGTVSSAFQYEGAAGEGGRGPCIWDTFSHIPGTITGNATADVAVDQYHHYKEDTQLMKDLNMDSYRMSISWSRIFPDGVGPEPNWEGVAYYNDIIDELLIQGIDPFVTLYHWDLPQALNDTIGGWGNHSIIPLFVRYADLCFAQFGDRVKRWITFNEPFGHLTYSFDAGSDCGNNCTPSDFTTHYAQGHNLLLSHAYAVQLYRKKYKAKQQGVFGMALDANVYWPFSNKSEDINAATRGQLFEIGWFLDPMVFGDYPDIMKEIIGARLPQFTKEESQLMKGSMDFVGVNYYTTWYIRHDSSHQGGVNMFIDPALNITFTAVKDGVQIGPQAGSIWLYIVPWGMQSVLNWIRIRYNNPPVYITENGVDEKSTSLSLLNLDSLQDNMRIDFHRDYFHYLIAAIKDGCDVRGYFVWSLLDNFEWSSGYSVRFGLYYVDFLHGLKRYPKASANWFRRLLSRSPSMPSHEY